MTVERCKPCQELFNTYGTSLDYRKQQSLSCANCGGFGYVQSPDNSRSTLSRLTALQIAVPFVMSGLLIAFFMRGVVFSTIALLSIVAGYGVGLLWTRYYHKS